MSAASRADLRRRLERLTRIVAALLLLAGTARTTDAQYLTRPHLQWRTLETPRFSFYFPQELEGWSRDVAERMESIDSAVSRIVGFTPRRRTRIIVDDPYNVSNGFALPLLDGPVINLWAMPPSPREDIGNVREWGEMLAVHEFAHVAHLARPSRNARTRLLWQIIPIPLGPLTLRAPRWAIEGYATYVEGRLTGSGRPNHAWRAAILREWALEGRLPTYGQLSSWGDFFGGDMAYLAGSAFLEWLAAREGGDSSLVHVWRRLSARQTRSFDAAFAGVFGESPQAMYGHFTVDLTARALEARRQIAATAASEGELVQRLAWSTGDPSISRDGSRVAVVLRSRGRPSRVVVWKTTPEPDTLAKRAAERLRERDPEDVPPKRIYPPARKAEATLLARAGRAFEDPRFMPDGRQILLWRHTVRSDGSVRPDLYLWSFEGGAVRRVTHGAAVREADPSPDGHAAAAVRCEHGRCDLVEVDLTNGSVRLLVMGSYASPFYRPRYSPDGRTLAVAALSQGRWRIALVDVARPAVRFVDPEDGANRYDVSWRDGATLLAVSERGGIMNIERLDLATRVAQPLTRQAGGAFAPEPNRADGSVWFLGLHSRGYDVRRTPAAAEVTAVSLDPELAPAAPPLPASAPLPARQNVGSSRDYGFHGPRSSWRGFWVPVPHVGADGSSAELALSASDAVGRLSVLLQGRYGSDASWRGGALAFAWRGMRPELEASGFIARQWPSRGPADGVVGSALDVRIAGASMAARFDHYGDASRLMLRAGVSQASVAAPTTRGDRSIAFARGSARLVRSGDQRSLSADLTLDGTAGALDETWFRRGSATLGIQSAGARTIPFDARIRYGRVSHGAPMFEQFALGGMPGSLLDGDILSQRISAPTLPTGAAVGDELLAYRLALPGMLSPYYEAFRLSGSDPSGSRAWHRSYGLEITLGTAAIPVLATPAARIFAGVGHSIDEPFRHRTQAYIGVLLAP